ncbi:MAG: HyaD/HybD family hydrogenase maturation endopeptidase [Sulfurimonadaceae bacterium]
MSDANYAILGVGNILEKDDGMAVYATAFLEQNYTFEPAIDIINGGVEGINLLNHFMEYDRILILDTISIDDEPGTVYHIPSSELTGYGLNSGGAHEIGVLQCLDILEMMDKPLPESSVLGIIPEEITLHIGLSETLTKQFTIYIETVVKILEKNNFKVKQKSQADSLREVIEHFASPKRD